MSSNDDGRLDLQGLGGHNSSGSGINLVLAVTRLDAKFDAVMRMMTMRDETVGREIRSVQVEHKEDHGDHEVRLRALEARPILTPKSVYAMLGLLLTVVSAAAAVVGLIIKGP